jgi:hypothetical protein
MITSGDFATFDAANPRVWEAFCVVVAEYRQFGATKWSADAALHVVRWRARTDINNDYSAYYARKWLQLNPDARGFFELRASIADAKPSGQLELEV